jgi:hypothetical protein
MYRKKELLSDEYRVPARGYEAIYLAYTKNYYCPPRPKEGLRTLARELAMEYDPYCNVPGSISFSIKRGIVAYTYKSDNTLYS